MQDENVTPAGPPAAARIMTDEVSVQADKSMGLDQEPPIGETTINAEDTAQTTTTEAPEAQAVDGGEAEHSSKVISDLGESRKKIAEKFIESARKSGIAAEDLKELVRDNPDIEKYVRTKFGNDYDRLVKEGVTPTAESFDPEEIEKIKKKAKIEAQLEAAQEEMARAKQKQLDVFAQTHGLNTDEYEQLKETADYLEGKYEYEDALDKALMLVSRDKAINKSRVQLPTGTNDPAPQRQEVSRDAVDYIAKYDSTRSREDIAKSLERVERGISKDAKGREIFRPTTNF